MRRWVQICLSQIQNSGFIFNTNCSHSFFVFFDILQLNTYLSSVNLLYKYIRYLQIHVSAWILHIKSNQITLQGRSSSFPSIPGRQPHETQIPMGFQPDQTYTEKPGPQQRPREGSMYFGYLGKGPHYLLILL